jgi:hypothetical protein
MTDKRPRGPKTGRSKHPWYWTWKGHERNINCPWANFEEFKAWAESRGYDPKAGDRIALNYSRLYGFAPRIRKPGQLDPLLESEPELASPRLVRGSVTQQAIMRQWQAMMERCYVKTDPLYERVGSAGIVVCKEWHDFDGFFTWASRTGGARDGVELVRRDHERDYGPNNCVFV